MLLQFLGDSLPFLRFTKDAAHLDVADFAVVDLNKVLLQEL